MANITPVTFSVLSKWSETWNSLIVHYVIFESGRATMRIIHLLILLVSCTMDQFNGDAETFETVILDRQRIAELRRNDHEFINAMNHAVSCLDEFRHKWEERARNETDFTVVVGIQQGQLIVPAALEITSISGPMFSGRILGNNFDANVGTMETASTTQIIDWFYQDSLELVGGSLYRHLLNNQSEITKRVITDAIPFYVRDDSTMSDEVRRCFSVVANSRVALINEDLKRCLACGSDEHVVAVRRDRSVRTMRASIAEYACIFGNAEIIEQFVSHRILVEREDEYTPLLYSCGTGNIVTSSALLKLGFNPNIVNEETGYTPLIIAAKRGHADVVKLLLENNADTSVRDYGEETAMHYAESAKVATLLISSGADINAYDSSGRTVLSRQIDDEHEEIALMLVRLGATRQPSELRSDEKLSENQTLKLLKEHAARSDELDVFNNAFDVNFGRVLPIRELGRL